MKYGVGSNSLKGFFNHDYTVARDGMGQVHARRGVSENGLAAEWATGNPHYVDAVVVTVHTDQENPHSHVMGELAAEEALRIFREREEATEPAQPHGTHSLRPDLLGV